MSEVDTLRWGDVQTLAFQPAPGGAGGFTGVTSSKQLVHAHWQRPCTWKVLVSIHPQLPATELGTFKVTVQFVIGCGGGFISFDRVYTFAPTAGVYTQQLDIFDVPAQDIQASVTNIDLSGATQDALAESWLAGIFVAPITEPAGYTDLRDIVRAVTEHFRDRQGYREPDHEGQPRWMPPGFDDGEVRYR